MWQSVRTLSFSVHKCTCMYMYSSSQKKVMFLFHLTPSRQNDHSMHKKWKRDGAGTVMGKWRNVHSTIPIIASMKKTPGESKKTNRSIVLSKQSHLEVIWIDWQREVDWSSIADFNPSWASTAEFAQNRRAAVVHCPRRWWQYKTIDSSCRANELAFHFYTSANHAHYYQLYAHVHVYGTETEWVAVNNVMPPGRGGTEQKYHHFWLLLYKWNTPRSAHIQVG